MDPRIKTILEYAVMAPSGDNCQPWRVAVDGLKVRLFNDPEMDRSLYNLKQRASLVAHGAFLENLCLAASSVGLEGQVKLLPDPQNLDHTATVTFVDGRTECVALFNAIPQRHTNREKYSSVNISDTQIQQWQSLAEQSRGNVWIGCHPDQISRLARLLSLNDRLVFEVGPLHDFLFEQIRWSDEEARLTGDGLDIQTLGLNAMDRFAFQFLKNWWLVGALNRIGFPLILQFKAKQLIQSSSAVAIVTMPGSKEEDYLDGGRLWQRLLLQLASEGLTAQPIAGLACLMQAAHEGLLEKVVSAKHRELLSKTRNELLISTESDDSKVILAMFRIGRGPQVVRALRRPLKSFLTL